MKTYEIEHTLQMVGYHVACIMTQDSKIDCSPHRNMPPFVHELTEHNRVYVKNLYMAEVAKLFTV